MDPIPDNAHDIDLDMKCDGIATESATALAPILTPHGRLLLEPVDDAAALSSDLSHRLRTAFARGSGHGLLQLGAAEVGTMLPPVFGYWREFGARYVSAMCGQPDLDTSRSHTIVGPPSGDGLEKLAAAVPPMVGAEYLTPIVLEALWHELGAAVQSELAESKASVQDFLRRKSPAWQVVGRVHFNLAENRLDAEAPFALLATYTARLSGHAKAQHLPLGRALTEYAGAANRSRLLSLLVPVQRAAEQCGWLKSMVDSGEIFHPLRWMPAEAYQLLTDLSRLEAAGVIVRVPGTWRANRPSRPQVSAVVGAKPPTGFGTDALLDFRMDVTLDGERLTASEIAELLAASEGLHLVRGRWVEVDRAKLGRMLDEFRAVEKVAKENGLDLAAAMRLLAGARVSGPVQDDQLDAAAADWSRVAAGPWLAKTLEALRHPDALARIDPGDELKAVLRPYQQAGVRWLHLLSSLGLGACLADDMGLGKTMQVLALLLVLRRQSGEHRRRTSVMSTSVMARICEPKTGLFPAPKEISFRCSCPDWAWMCKHVAAVLYGIGARLDDRPELLFLLRRVDQQDLIAGADSGFHPTALRTRGGGPGLRAANRGPAAAKVLDTGDLSQVFGIEIAQSELPARQNRTARDSAAPSPRAHASGAAAGRTKPAAAERAVHAASRTETPVPTLSAAKRASVSSRMKKYWRDRRRRDR